MMTSRTMGTIALAAAVAAAAGGCGKLLGGNRAGSTAAPAVAQQQGIPAYVAAVGKLRTGDQEAAILDLERAVAQNPQLRMARMTLGEIYLDRKEYAKAVPQFEAASELDPYTLSNHYNLGLALQVLNRLQEAAVAYIRALRLDPQDFGSNMNLGLVYFALGQLDAAGYHLEKATRIRQDSHRAWSNLGIVYDARGNPVLAEAAYRRALELDPGNASTLLNLTSNLITQKKGREAADVAKQRVAKLPDAQGFKRLGDAHALVRQWPDAAAAYDLATSMDKTYTPALNAKAEMLIARYEDEAQLNDSLRQQAVALWQQSLRANANQPGVVELAKRWQAAGRGR